MGAGASSAALNKGLATAAARSSDSELQQLLSGIQGEELARLRAAVASIDTPTPQPEAKPQTDAPQPEAAASQLEAAAPEPEAAAPEVAAPRPEAAAPQPEAAAPQPETAAPQPVAAAPQPEAAAVTPLRTPRGYPETQVEATNCRDASVVCAEKTETECMKKEQQHEQDCVESKTDKKAEEEGAVKVHAEEEKSKPAKAVEDCISDQIEVPAKGRVLSEAQIEQIRESFKAIDTDGSNAIDKSELKAMTKALGLEMYDEEVDSMLQTIDVSGNGIVEFDEYLIMVTKALQTV